MSSNKECYQVKVEATMTNELKCLYEKLGDDMFQIRVLSNFDALLVEPNPIPSEFMLSPEILEVEFDKCDCDKVTFTLYVELPCLIIPDVDENDDMENDKKVLPVDYNITTSGHKHPVSIKTFTVYPLAENCNSRGFDTECWSYEICRVPCLDASEQIPASESFRVTFPLSREVACLVPEFGLSGFYLKNLVSANLKTKVRLVPGNVVLTKGEGGIPGALLSYDPERCEACLEFCTEDYECIIKGYEHLFNVACGTSPASPTVADMALNRRFDVKGVSKCTEKVLFSFELCFKPPLACNSETSMMDVMNYKIIGNTSGDVCYEFKSVCVTGEVALPQ